MRIIECRVLSTSSKTAHAGNASAFARNLNYAPILLDHKCMKRIPILLSINFDRNQDNNAPENNLFNI